MSEGFGDTHFLFILKIPSLQSATTSAPFKEEIILMEYVQSIYKEDME